MNGIGSGVITWTNYFLQCRNVFLIQKWITNQEKWVNAFGPQALMEPQSSNLPAWQLLYSTLINYLFGKMYHWSTIKNLNDKDVAVSNTFWANEEAMFYRAALCQHLALTPLIRCRYYAYMIHVLKLNKWINLNTPEQLTYSKPWAGQSSSADILGCVSGTVCMPCFHQAFVYD